MSTEKERPMTLGEIIDWVHSLNIGGLNRFDGTRPWRSKKQVVIVPVEKPLGAVVVVKTRSCQLQGCRFNVDGFCNQSFCVNYTFYRKETGMCETCGAKIAKAGGDAHVSCEGCGALLGKGHEHYGTRVYCEVITVADGLRGEWLDLCKICIRDWHKMDTFIGRKLIWDEYSKGLSFDEFFSKVFTAARTEMATWLKSLAEEENGEKRIRGQLGEADQKGFTKPSQVRKPVAKSQKKRETQYNRASH